MNDETGLALVAFTSQTVATVSTSGGVGRATVRPEASYGPGRIETAIGTPGGCYVSEKHITRPVTDVCMIQRPKGERALEVWDGPAKPHEGRHSHAAIVSRFDSSVNPFGGDQMLANHGRL